LRPKFRNIADASVGGLILDIPLDNALDLFERIVENQSMRLSDMEVMRKTTGIYNVDVVTALTVQMEVITRNLDSLTYSVNIVQTPAPKCTGLFIDAGSRFETEETNGTAHFLEHMIFKGTERRSARGLEEEIENMGGHLNAYTSREQTTYYAKVMDKNVPQALDILSDILQNSKFEENRINRERDVILREMEEEKIVLKYEILFICERVEFFVGNKQEGFKCYYHNKQTLILLPNSEVSHQAGCCQKLKYIFCVMQIDVFSSQKFRYFLKLDIPHLTFQGYTDYICSELAQRVGINEIAESMMAFNTNYKDTGLFGVYAVAKPDCLDDLAYAIMYEISKLCYRVSEADVIRARNQDNLELLWFFMMITKEELLTYGRRIPFAELFARIDSVDASTVKRVANRFIFDRDVAITAMGPVQGLPDYNWFRRRTYWLRY
ncbi:probable mitochondrial-processing peptidase subunit beta, mitochondrial, partial [Olea europaea subsp. europaea]